MTPPVMLLLFAVVGGLAFGVPGVWLSRVWLGRFGLSWRVCAALIFAAESVLAVLLHIGGVGWLLPPLLIAQSVGGAVGAALLLRGGLPRPEPLWAFDAALALFFIAPGLVLYLPLDTDAQGFGYLALMLRESGLINSLAPWQPEVRYLYSPVMFIWWAAFSRLFGDVSMHVVMLAFSHLLAACTALLCIDVGQALAPDRPRWRWLYPLLFAACLGFFLNLMDAAYTSLLGIFFIALFLITGLQALRDPQPVRITCAALALAAVPLSHPDGIIILLIGYIPFYFTFWLINWGEPKPSLGQVFRGKWLPFFVIIPAVGVLLTLPWAIYVLPLFLEETILSPFPLGMRHWVQLILYQGVLVPLIAVPGLLLAARRRAAVDVLMLTWLIFMVDFSLFGFTDRLIDLFGFDVMRYAYPFSIAWHGPPLVYAFFAALALDALLDRQPVTLHPRLQWVLPAAAGALMLLAVLFNRPLIEASRCCVNFFGTFSSRADLEAMAYLRTASPPDALILNYPHGFEGHWVPVIAERHSVTFREQPFFTPNVLGYYQRRDSLIDAYFDPAAQASAEALRATRVGYVIYPQIVTQPESYADLASFIRWRWPAETWYALRSSPGDAPWLERVFSRQGAEVYRVTPAQ